MGKKWYSDLADGIARQVILIAYAMVVSGHLPLVMPLLLIATLSETLVMANSVMVGCKQRGQAGWGAWGPHLHSFERGEGVPEQGPWPLRGPGVFLEFLEPRLEPPRASIRAP